MLLLVLSFIIHAIYLLLPIAGLIVAIRWHKRWRGAAGAVMVAIVAGFAVSVALNFLFAKETHGRLTSSQIAIGGYFACAMFLLLRLCDQGLQWLLRRLLVLDREQSTRLRGTRTFLFTAARVCILFAFGLPYVMASILVYRPKVAPVDDPRNQLGFDFQRVEFRTSDGIEIVAWWIPAQSSPQHPTRRTRGNTRDPLWGKQTALICHGLASSKSNQLILARDLVPGGYNCLALDFRAHGESGGQITTYGDLEKRDVLAAIRWLEDNHPSQSQRIVGGGARTGAAALIYAAADDYPQRPAIAAVASYACYDNLWDTTDAAAHTFFAPPLDWLLLHVSLPIAAIQSGADLVDYSPARDVAALWPRPVLLMHSQHDDIIDYSRGQSLLDAASQPKYHVWFTAGSHDDLISSEPAARIVLEFFRTAKPVPVI